MKKRSRPKDKMICLCNSIPESVIKKSIKKGATSLGEIFDQTTAGVGACGGSCQPQLVELLKKYSKGNQEGS